MDKWGIVIHQHPLLVALWLVLLAMLLYQAWIAIADRNFLLEPDVFIEMLNHQQAKLFDIRERSNYEKSHLPQADWIAASNLKTWLQNRPNTKKRQPILLYCENGAFSRSLAKELRQQFEALYVLKGGIREWQREHMPLIRAASDVH